jgi:hypothetical protein
LEGAGFRNAIYVWQLRQDLQADSFFKYFRDVSFHEFDLLVLYSATSGLNPLAATTDNILSTSTTANLIYRHDFVAKVCQSYEGEASSGIRHNTDAAQIRQIQQRIMISMSQRHKFEFWDVLAPSTYSLSLRQGLQLGRYGEGFMKRQRKIKEDAVSVLDRRYLKDYTNVFDAEDDVFSLYPDHMHYSDKAAQIVAEQFASDILKEFGGRE